MNLWQSIEHALDRLDRKALSKDIHVAASHKPSGRTHFLNAVCVFSIIHLSAFSAQAQAVDACHLFRSEQKFVTQTLYMAMEDVRHVLTIPEIYFEDIGDRVNGTEHRAQLFRMMMDDFTPVTRQDTADLLRIGRKDYFTFVLRDPIDLDGILPISASQMATGDGRDMSAYKEMEFDFGLRSVLPISGAEIYREVYVARNESGDLDAVFGCSNTPSFVNQGCNHDFRAHNIDVRMSYPREYLHDWQRLQSSVSDFISCALTQ